MNTTPELDQSVIKATEQFMSQSSSQVQLDIDTGDAKETTSHCAHDLELCFSDERYTVLHNLTLLAQDEVFSIKHLVLDVKTHHVILFDEIGEASMLKIDKSGYFLMQKKRGEALHEIRSPMDKMKKCQQRVLSFLKSIGYVCDAVDYFVIVSPNTQLEKPRKGFEHVCYLTEMDDQMRCEKRGICGALKLLKSGILSKWNAQYHKANEVSAFMRTLQSQP